MGRFLKHLKNTKASVIILKLMNKRAAFIISLAAVLAYWGYVIAVTARTVPELPATLTEILLSIVKIKLIVIAVVIILLKLEGDKFDQLGFRKTGQLKQILFGIGFGFATWIIINIVINPLLASVNPSPKPTSDILAFMKDPRNLLWWIPVVTLAAFAEELQRIFVLTRFQKWFGKYGLYIAIVITSIIFGIGHLYQGTNLAIGTGIGGFLNALVFLRKRSAWEVIICHAVFNILSVVGALFFGA